MIDAAVRQGHEDKFNDDTAVPPWRTRPAPDDLQIGYQNVKGFWQPQ
jgi:hypothetical protein